jgi:hypothetical protein
MTEPSRCRFKSSTSNETKKRGRKRNQTVARIMHEKGVKRAQAYRILDRRKQRRRTQREKLLAEPFCFSSIVRPTDDWDFAVVHYPRIDDQPGSHGYIPGDLYANCLFYFAKPGDLVVAPMAGSGQIKRVYEDRVVWTKGLDQPWDIDLRMFDLTPRGPYAALIGRWDTVAGFPPVERSPNYVILDPPYLNSCRGQYSDRGDDLANMDEAAWTEAMWTIARHCAQVEAKRCTIIVPTWVHTDTGVVVLCPEIVKDAWRATGYQLRRVCYASKRIQAARNERMQVLNHRAKLTKTPLSDISEVLTFDLGVSDMTPTHRAALGFKEGDDDDRPNDDAERVG